MPPVRSLAFVSCLVTGVVASSTAAADGIDPRAQALFDEGVAAMEAGRYAEGCPKLADAYRLNPLPGAIFTLAECEARWGHSAAALQNYEAYLERFRQMTPEERAKQRGREKVASSVSATLKARIADEAAARQNERDAAADPPPRAGEAAVTAPAPAHANVSPPSEDSPRPIAPWIIGGVGVAAILTGAAASVVALNAANEVDSRCHDHVCDKTGIDAVNRGTTWGWIGTGCLGVGLVAVGVAAIWLIASPKARSAARLGVLPLAADRTIGAAF